MSKENLKADAIFLAAIELDDAARAAYLDRECAGDAELRRLVDNLLKAVPRLGRFMEDPPLGERETADTNVAESPGAIIGPFKLLQELGEGGMGVVYLAEQEKPVRRRVALKVIRAGLDSSKVVARFEHERQALALMDHPNIARVLDAGVADNGRPYFAMELVHGISITKYCDQEMLSLQDRIKLFVPVCRAVQHAHQKGIIHRDLKPSNVIVGLYDGQPIPKVIDFGVAKATGQQLIERTLFTEVGQIIGTMEYMAPEQAEMNNLDVDTRADIYSLGVLLYELLTGAPPFTAQDLRKAGWGEMLRIIKEVEPTKPSTKITSAEDLPRVAANRRLEPARLARSIRGELDWITMKCLEKTRTRRYETAIGLAQDLERFLADEPVQACPPTTGYRLRKFAGKHRGLITGVAVCSLLLIAGTAISAWQAIRASRAQGRAVAGWTEAARQRDEARAQRRQTREALDTILDPEGMDWLGSQQRLSPAQRKFLQKAAAHYEALAVDSSTDREARLLVAQANVRVGELLIELGQLAEASKAIERAIEQFEQLSGEFPNDGEIELRLGKAYTLAGTLGENQGDHRAMEKAARRAVEYFDGLAKRNASADSVEPALAYNLRRLGLSLRLQNKPEESVAASRRAVDIQSAIAQAAPTANSELVLASYLLELGWSLERAHRPTESRAAFAEATTLANRLTSQADSEGLSANGLAQVLYQLIMAHLAVGEWPAVERTALQLIPLWETRASSQPSVPVYRLQLAQVHSFLGDSLIQQKKWAEAETALTRAIELGEGLAAERSRGFSIENLHQNRAALAMAQWMLGKHDSAESLIQGTLGAANPELRVALQVQWAYGLALSGSADAAVSAAQSISPKILRERSRADVGWSEYGLASTYALAAASTSDEAEAQRRTAEALAHLRAAINDGWSDADYLRNDADWAGLREHDEFKQILSNLQNKTAPSPEPIKASSATQ